MNRLLPLSLSLFFVCASCAKKATPTVTPTAPVTIQKVDFETFQGKAKLSYRQGEQPKKEFNANIRIKKNNTIWMSFSVFGILGGRILINQDSIVILNALNKNYTVLDYPTLSKQFNFKIDYPLLEAALLGNPIQQLGPNDQVRKTTGYTLLQQRRENADITNQIRTPQNKIEQAKLYNPKSNSSLTLNYDNFQAAENQNFPKKSRISLIYNTDGKTIAYTITLDYNTFKLNSDGLKFPFTIPQKYERR